MKRRQIRTNAPRRAVSSARFRLLALGAIFALIAVVAALAVFTFGDAKTAEAQGATLTVQDIGPTNATLKLTGHTTQWWYNASAGPHTNCQGPVAANTATKYITGLSAGVSYTYTAYSNTNCATSLDAAPAFTTLNQPTKPVATKSGLNVRLQSSYTPPSGSIHHWEYKKHQDGSWDSSWTSVTSTSTSLSHDVTGLTIAKKIKFKVRACTAANTCTDESDESDVVSVAGSTRISVSPHRITIDEGSSATVTINGYAHNITVQLTVTQSSDNSDVTTSPSGSVTITLSGGSGSQIFTITAGSDADAIDDDVTVVFTETGVGTKTTLYVTVNDTTKPILTAPGAPTNLSTTANQTNRTVALSWTAPTSNGGSAITGYTIEQTGQASATYNPSGTGTTFTTSTLAPGNYSFTVKAKNSEGTGSESNAATATINAPVGAPGAPTNLSATADQSNKTVALSWTASTNIGVSAITGYTIQQSGQASAAYNPSDTGTTFTTPALAAGDYSFTVAAKNSAGTGNASNTAAATIGASRPAAPAKPTLTAGTGSITVNWNAPSGQPITDYDVQYCGWTQADVDYCKNVSNWQDWHHSGTATTATITGLYGGHTHLVKVRAVNSKGQGEWSVTNSIKPNIGSLGAPQNLKVTAMEHQNGDWLKVDWDFPAWSGARVEEWHIKYRYCKVCDASNPDWSVWENQYDDGDGFSDDGIYNVTRGAKYQVQVRGRAYGWGAWSAVGEATTRAAGAKSSDDGFSSHSHPGLTAIGVGYDECWSGNQMTNHTHDGQRHWHCPAQSGGGGVSGVSDGSSCNAWYSNHILVDHSHPGTGCIVDWYYRSGHSHMLASGEEKAHSH